MSAVEGQRRGKKTTTTESPSYDDDYDEQNQDYESDEEGGTKDAATKETKKPISTTTTAKPAEEEHEESPKGPHSFLRPRKRLNRPSPHPAIRPKPTLPSFIKHPANFDHPEENAQKAPVAETLPPRPRSAPTTPKPSRFAAGTKKAKAETTTASADKAEEKKSSKFGGPTGKTKPNRTRFRGVAPPAESEE